MNAPENNVPDDGIPTDDRSPGLNPTGEVHVMCSHCGALCGVPPQAFEAAGSRMRCGHCSKLTAIEPAATLGVPATQPPNDSAGVISGAITSTWAAATAHPLMVIGFGGLWWVLNSLFGLGGFLLDQLRPELIDEPKYVVVKIVGLSLCSALASLTIAGGMLTVARSTNGGGPSRWRPPIAATLWMTMNYVVYYVSLEGIGNSLSGGNATTVWAGGIGLTVWLIINFALWFFPQVAMDRGGWAIPDLANSRSATSNSANSNPATSGLLPQLSRSVTIVSRNKTTTFLVFVVWSIVNSIGVLFCCVGTIITMPLSTVMIALIYDHARTKTMT